MMPPRHSERQLRQGEAATWGAKPKQQMSLRNWKRAPKPGALVGYADISLPYYGDWLDVNGCPVLVTNGRPWASWPGMPVLKEGAVTKIPGTGKVRYVNILHWRGHEISQRFSQAVVDLVRAEDPEAFTRERSQ